MKKRDVIEILKKNGWYLEREGPRHETWTNGKGQKTSVGRHTEIPEYTARSIIKMAEKNPG